MPAIGRATDVAIARSKTGWDCKLGAAHVESERGHATRPNERGSATSLGCRVWLDADRFMQLVGQACDLLGQPRVLREHLEVLLGHCALAH